MDFFNKFAKPAQDKPTSEDQETGSTQPSNTDLFGSAKVLAGAAQAQYSGETGSYDNAELAGAGANILGGASEYGKLDETQGVGKYVNDAEGYLKQYSSTNTKTATTGDDDADVKPITTPGIPSVDDTEGADASEGYAVDKEDGFSKKPVGGDDIAEADASDEYGKSGESYEENTAKNFPKKPSVEEDEYTGADASDKYGGDTTEDFENKPSGGGGAKFSAADETETYRDETAADFPDKSSGGGGDYTGAVASEVKYGQSEEDKEDGFTTKIPGAGDTYTGSDESDKFGQSGEGYGEDTEESFSKKPLGGGTAAGADAGDEYGQSGDGYGQYVKKAEGFFNKP